jgi:hypothetical protein
MAVCSLDRDITPAFQSNKAMDKEVFGNQQIDVTMKYEIEINIS